MLLLKPKIVEDIKSKKYSCWRDSYKELPERLNLSYRNKFRISLSFFFTVVVISSSLTYMVVGSALAPTISTLAAGDSSGAQQERDALEAQLKDLEKQIGDYEDQIVGYQKQGKSLKTEISGLDSKIAKLKLQIKAVNLNIQQLNDKIVETTYQISATQKNIEDSKTSLAEILKDLYQSERISTIEVLLSNPKLSDFFDNLNSINLLQNSLQIAIARIQDLQTKLTDQKDQLSLVKEDAATLKQYQESQRQVTEQTKQQKNTLLSVTKGQESKYQVLLTETKKTAAEIRNRIFQLLGGGELTFEQAYEYAKLASGATGIDAGFILAVLDRESALGKNVGKCKYTTAMHPTRDIPIFLQITKDLNLDPNTLSVSCANSDGAYGGAMGPAQFIPSTWDMYKKAISKVTGNNPPSPWSNVDAFAATALYLKDAMSGCTSLYKTQESRERCAAAKYYAGGRWKSYLWTYGEATVSRAIKFREDIKTITS